LDGDELRLEKKYALAEVRQVLPGSFRDSNGNLLFMNEFNGPGRGIVRLTPEEELSIIKIPTPGNKNMTGYHFSTARLPVTLPILRGKIFPQRADSTNQLVVSMAGTSTSRTAPRYGNIVLLDLPVSENPDYRIISNKQGIEVRNVLCTAQDKAGRIWFGHGSTGMGVYDPVRDTAQTWKLEEAGDPGAIAMVIDRYDRLWLAGTDGVYYIDNASTLALQPTPHLRARRKKCLLREVPSSYVASLLLRGDTLIAGHGGGVSFINISGDVVAPPAVTIPLPAYGLGAAEQNALLIDREGMLWVGANEGAVRLDYKQMMRGRRTQGRVELAVAGDQGPVLPTGNKYKLHLNDSSLSFGFKLSIPDQQANLVKGDLLLLNGRGDTLKIARAVSSGTTIRRSYLDPVKYSLVLHTFLYNQLIDDQRATLLAPPG
jgi:hypothetical protein